MFIKGMDISSHLELMDKGYKYYDFEGSEVNILDFARAQGFNYGRLRIWNEPERVVESGGYCSLEHTKKMSKEITSRGLGFLLDFHYSDWWADPGKQNKPFAWKDLSGKELEQAVYDYTKNVLIALDENDTYPDMVQIGNEIRCGMLWPDGLATNWEGLSKLINAGIRAVRDTQKKRDTKVMLHLDQGGRFYYFKEWFDNALAHGVTDFDIIGLSYYPFWHGTFYDLKNTMEELVRRYNKPLIIAEAAHAYCLSGMFGEEQEKIAGFPAGGDAQKQVLELIMSIAAHVSDDKGLGVFYWEPFARPNDENDEGWGSCMGVVDKEGRPTRGIKAFSYDPMSADIDANAKIYAPADIAVPKNYDIEDYLPKTVNVLKFDGRLEKENVVWELDKNILIENDKCVIKGTLSKCKEAVELSVRLVDNCDEENLIKNADFEKIYDDVPEYWDIARVSSDNSLIAEIRQETYEQSPLAKSNYIYFKGESNFGLAISQSIPKLMEGRYRFSLFYKGDNTTGVKVNMHIKDESGALIAVKEIFPSAEAWTRYDMEFVLEHEGAVRASLMIDAPAIYGMMKQPSLILCKGE